MSSKVDQAVSINMAEIPDYARDRLAEATLDLLRGILRQPGGREALDAKKAARKKEEQEGREN